MVSGVGCRVCYRVDAGLDVVHRQPLRAESLHQVQRREHVTDSGCRIQGLAFRVWGFWLQVPSRSLARSLSLSFSRS